MPCWCKGKCPHIGPAQELVKQKNPHRAKWALRNALTVAPLCVEANLMLANILCGSNHAHAAMVHVDRAAKQADPARIHFERGKVLRADMKLEPAREEFYKAMQAAPENPHAAAGLVGALEMAGHLPEALTVCRAARARFPEYLDLRRLEAVILDAQGDTTGALVVCDLPADKLLPIELLDRGRYLEKAGLYADAWYCWNEGKKVTREKWGHIYNPDYFQKQFAALRDAATAPRPNFVRRAPDLETTPAPLFICGFPRSGTTLAETIFSAHSAVIAGDELMGISDVIEAMPAWCKVRMPYPGAMVATSLGENAAIPELLRDLYLRGAQERLGFVARSRVGRAVRKPYFFTDKMPLNELHLPLLRMLFSGAPIIRMQRHPLDVMVSCMSNWLAHGGFYASSLEICARHYLAVDEVVQHYERQFAIQDRRGLINFRYEDLVMKDQQEQTAGLLALAGLPLEPACLAFHKSKRTARTLSYRQVKQPMNAAGVGRWKNFRDQLAPAIEILRPILEREGYEF